MRLWRVWSKQVFELLTMHGATVDGRVNRYQDKALSNSVVIGLPFNFLQVYSLFNITATPLNNAQPWRFFMLEFYNKPAAMGVSEKWKDHPLWK